MPLMKLRGCQFRPIGVLPTVYDDALSYEEQVSKLAKKCNEIVDYVNEFDKDLQNYVNEWLDNHPEATTTVEDGSLTLQKFTDYLKLQTENCYVVPEMFGAKGDGVTDDSNAFAMMSNFSDEFKINMRLTSGKTYVLTTFHLPSDITFDGNNGTLKIKDNVAVDSSETYYFVENLNENNTKIINVNIDGNSSHNTQYTVFDCITAVGTNTEVIGCNIKNAPDSAIMFSAVVNGRCDYNMIDSAEDCGIYVNSGTVDNLKGCSISNNKIQNAKVSGIALKRYTTKTVVCNNIIFNCEYGISFERANTAIDFSYKSVVSNNYIEDVDNGIYILGGSDYNITGNNIINFKNNSIGCYAVENVVINANILESSDDTPTSENSSVIALSNDNIRHLKNINISNNVINVRNTLNTIISIGSTVPTNITNLQIEGNNVKTVGENFLSKNGHLIDSIISNNVANDELICALTDENDDVYYNNNLKIKLWSTKAIPALLLDVARDTTNTAKTARIMNNTRSSTALNASTFKQGDIVIDTVETGTVIYYANDDGLGSSVLQALVTL